MNKIIAIAGRKLSGKSLLSKTLIEEGFEKFSFADYLKKTVSNFFQLQPEDLYDQVRKEKEFDTFLVWNEEVAKGYSQVVDVDLVPVGHFGTVIKTPRQLLQFVGTEILKSYDKLFHVKKTIENLNPSKNYVCDDLRFPEERDALRHVKDFEFSDFFVIKPNNRHISNHISETALNWSMFSRIIINCGTIEKFKNDFLRARINNYSTICVPNKAFLPEKTNSQLSFSSQECFFAGVIMKHGIFEEVKNKENTNYQISILRDNLNLNGILLEIDALIDEKSEPPFMQQEFFYDKLIINCPFVIENLKFFQNFEENEQVSQFDIAEFKRGMAT